MNLNNNNDKKKGVKENKSIVKLQVMLIVVKC